MPTGRVGYHSVAELLRAEPLAKEYPGTRRLIDRLRPIRARGEFSRAEFLAMCRWKSPRAARHYRRHRAASIGRVSRALLSTQSERRRMELLTGLAGVSVPIGSAILTLIDPRRYGVLDIRVWQLLFAVGAVEGKPGGRGFRVADWLAYLATLRGQARRRGVGARAIELTLFEYHRRVQVGRLYDPPSAPTRKRARRRRHANPRKTREARP